MPRAAELTESLPAIVPATPPVAAAIEAFLVADEAARDAGWLSPAHLDRERAWGELETLLLRLPRAWHEYKGVAWGLMKKSKRGFELARRDPDTIRQAPNEQGDPL
jgi:hypothetical protein